MRRLILVLFVVLSSQLFGQNYKILSESTQGSQKVISVKVEGFQDNDNMYLAMKEYALKLMQESGKGLYNVTIVFVDSDFFAYSTYAESLNAIQTLYKTDYENYKDKFLAVVDKEGIHIKPYYEWKSLGY